jgi:LmbE family N-acetylglucosaminyl deacetylase
MTSTSSDRSGELDDGAFSTDSAGTDESAWRTSLADVPRWMPPQSRRLTVVSPHPDDETLGAGGLIYTCADLGYEITIVLVTDGEAARSDVENLADRRVGELRSALMRLAPDGARVARLGFPDGKVAAYEWQLVDRLLLTVPSDAVLVAPYEQDGHTDHAATSRACQEAARRLGIQCVRYPIWAWHRLQPADFGSRAMGRFELSHAARDAKHEAIDCYRSQIEPSPGGAVVPPHVRTYFERPYEVFLL